MVHCHFPNNSRHRLSKGSTLSAYVWLALRNFHWELCHHHPVTFMYGNGSKGMKRAEPVCSSFFRSQPLRPESKAKGAKTDLSICWHHQQCKSERDARGWISGFMRVGWICFPPVCLQSMCHFPHGLGPAWEEWALDASSGQAISPMCPCVHSADISFTAS